jgi:hypothetical protein
VLFSERQTQPVQIPTSAGELQSRKLAALVARLSENHKLAFFARSVLLVEGPSDEIVVSALSLKLEHPLLGSNTQVVPVTGKGQIAETVKLFRLMGKRVFVLADLDALIDDNQLVSAFGEAARTAANDAGMGTVMEIDRGIRDNLATLLDQAFNHLQPAAETHRYWIARDHSPAEELKAKRRATVAALLTSAEAGLAQSSIGTELKALRKRYEALVELMAKAGCTFLRRGTIEDYYFSQFPATSYTKPEANCLQAGMIAKFASNMRTSFRLWKSLPPSKRLTRTICSGNNSAASWALQCRSFGQVCSMMN